MVVAQLERASPIAATPSRKNVFIVVSFRGEIQKGNVRHHLGGSDALQLFPPQEPQQESPESQEPQQEPPEPQQDPVSVVTQLERERPMAAMPSRKNVFMMMSCCWE